MTVKEQYDQQAKSLKLPPFDMLFTEYDLGDIDKEASRVVKEVAKKIFERSDEFRKILEASPQPESLMSMHEAEHFS